LGERVLEEACVCPDQYNAVVGIELYVHDLLIKGACYGDSSGKSDFDRSVHGGYHGVCVWVGHGYDEVGRLLGCVFAKV
jgi:hypothetical protein